MKALGSNSNNNNNKMRLMRLAAHDNSNSEYRRGVRHGVKWTIVIVFILGTAAANLMTNANRIQNTCLTPLMTTTTAAEAEIAGVHDNEQDGPFCSQNPYLPMLNTTHSSIQIYGSHGLQRYQEHANVHPSTDHNHDRFRVFEVTAPCVAESCIGGTCGQDTSKVMCGLETLLKNEGGGGGDDDKETNSDTSTPSLSSSNNPPPAVAPCIVYSIGGNNQWEFELDILQRTLCHVHTFDCTGNITRFQVPEHERLFFHYECLHGGGGSGGEGNKDEEKPDDDEGKFFTLAELTEKYNHAQIDLFKMDIEGFEWGVFEEWHRDYTALSSTGNNVGSGNNKNNKAMAILPMQMLVEIHYRTIRELYPYIHRDWKSEKDLVELARKLFDMGYAVSNHDDNTHCLHCVELTMVRTYC